METFNTRKIVSGLVLLMTAILVTYWKGDVPTNLSSFMQTLYGAFVIGNGMEHYTAMKVSQTASEAEKETK